MQPVSGSVNTVLIHCKIVVIYVVDSPRFTKVGKMSDDTQVGNMNDEPFSSKAAATIVNQSQRPSMLLAKTPEFLQRQKEQRQKYYATAQLKKKDTKDAKEVLKKDAKELKEELDEVTY